MCRYTDVRYRCFGCGKHDEHNAKTTRHLCSWAKWKSWGSPDPINFWGKFCQVNHDVEYQRGDDLCTKCQEHREERSGLFAEIFWTIANEKKSKTWSQFLPMAFSGFKRSPWDLWIFVMEILEDPLAAFARIRLPGIRLIVKAKSQ
ncbi:hypothetical protein PFICI_00519 [Pestalotiopsis fici W106-1]|uniref:Uncharacterized protein n=1 Tax=Pestalotiopsis fici (strain W106-1 / CGMCC3.15140) TaxID=1229662 RepID=W3XN39_PESFW|nr:uncharacterized protein PFICI_00519 [Pestalotiopsis fici W106-1]ETS86691.1 hypothetical protein PFICI_00519 [Pestalotiopsis fici W106-1]